MSATAKDVLHAIRELVHRADRNEAATDYIKSFLQIIDFEKLSVSNNEILFGRNGTGKTHLFRAFEQHCYANFDIAKVLPVYIDCRRLDVGSLGSGMSLERLLTLFYKRLVRKILTDLKQFSDQVITRGHLERFFGGAGRSRRDKIDASFRRLQHLLEEGTIDERVKEYVRTVEKDREGSARLSGGLGFSAKIAGTDSHGEAEAKGEFRGGVALKSKRKLETIYNGLAVIDYDEIRSHIEIIIENSGAKAVIVLIDEWSDLPRDVQPLIAEMVKKTLGTSSHISLKIAALKFFCWPSARLEDGRRIGLTRANLSVLADLDALLRFETQEQAVKDFLTLMLYKHVTAIDSGLVMMSAADFENALCNEVFEGQAAYQELIRASEGNPRDFLRLLGNCCNKNPELNAGKPITGRMVRAAGMNYFQNDKEPEIADNKVLTEAFDKLFQLVTSGAAGTGSSSALTT